MSKKLFKLFIFSLLLLLNSCSSDLGSGIQTTTGFNATKEAVIPVPFVGSIVENSLPAVIIGKIVLGGISTSQILTIKLSGTGSENFSITNEGVISVSNTGNLDYENVKIYNLIAQAIDGTGATLIAVKVTINITDIVEVAPQILPFTGSVSENSLAGTLVGKLSMLGVNVNNLSAITLSGSGNTNFIASVTGSISVAQGSSLDFESVSSYTLNVSAIDKAGKSLAVSTVSISLIDVVEIAPSITAFKGTVPENSLPTTQVGKLEIVGISAKNISSISLSGTGKENFVISNDGSISVASGAILDYETVNSYRLSVSIINSLGKVVAVSTVEIGLVDILEVNPSIASFRGTVAENSIAGKVIGTLSISGINSTNLSSFVLTGTGSQNFKVGLSGTISIESGAKLDYETIPSYSLNVKALDKRGNTLALAVVDIILVDVVELSPLITPFSVYVAENSSTGTNVGTIILSNMPSNLLSIRLTGTGNQNFNVSNGGVVTVNSGAILDYEGIRAYSFIIEAVDSLGKIITASRATINLTDVIEVLPSINTLTARVPENSSATTVVGTIVTAGITSTNLASYIFRGTGKENFSISNSGVITVAQGAILNYEALNSYSLIVDAVSRTGSTLASNRIIINLDDVVEPSAGITAFSGSVAENSPLNTVVGQVVLNNMPSSLLSLRLSGTGSEKFNINVTGNIIVSSNAKLDYEGVNRYNLIVEAINNVGGTITASTVTILITDVNEPIPIISPFTISIPENKAVGTIVGSLSMSNIVPSSLLAITLTGAGSEKFDVNKSGVIKVATGATFSYSTQSNYNFIVQALDKNGNSISASTVKISIISGGFVSKVVPQISSFTANLNEHSATGTNVGSIIIVNKGDSNITSFRLLGAGKDNFNVSIDGNITVSATANLVFATTSIYSLVAIATNGAGDSLSVTVTINILNISKTVPILKEFTGTINENASIGIKIGTIDINTTGNVPILSMQLNGTSSNNFVISKSGDILLATAINLNAGIVPIYNLLATATNSEGTSYAVPVTITVINKPPSKPIIDNVTISVSQSKAINSIIGTISILTDGGGTTFKSFDLNETSTDFNISNSGLVSLLPSKNLVAGTRNRYDFNITATNNDNLTSDRKLLIINITSP